MNIRRMQQIDFWLGVPLCAIATAALRVLGRRTAAPRPRRILFIGLSELGSTILAGPAMRKARDELKAELYFLTSDVNFASVGLTGLVPAANVFSIRIGSLASLARDTFVFLAWARRNELDTVVDLELFSRFSALLTGCSGAARTVGFHRFHQEGLYRGGMLTHRVAYNPHIHIAKGFVALVDALLSRKATIPYSKTVIEDSALQFSLPPVEVPARDAILVRVRAALPQFDPPHGRLVLLNPNSGDLLPLRRWPTDRYLALARRILAGDPQASILVTGSESDRENAARLAAEVNDPRCASFAGQTSLADLRPLYAIASVMVTNDSGPAHIAAASSLPTVALFGPETPRLYGPLGAVRVHYAGLACSPCATAYNHRRTACTDNACMQAIEVDAVCADVVSILALARKPAGAGA